MLYLKDEVKILLQNTHSGITLKLHHLLFRRMHKEGIILDHV